MPWALPCSPPAQAFNSPSHALGDLNKLLYISRGASCLVFRGVWQSAEVRGRAGGSIDSLDEPPVFTSASHSRTQNLPMPDCSGDKKQEAALATNPGMLSML